jgi:aryl-alcohol dehydrogenase-like predicted oxidoreductase
VTAPADTAPAARAGLWTFPDGPAVTRVGYGVMQLPGPGVWGPPADRAAALALLRRAVELGVTHVDTSDFYGPHVANELLREALFPYPDELVIATKVGVARNGPRRWDPAASPADLRAQVEENLRRLGRDHLDLVYLRVGGDGVAATGDTPLAASFQALVELRDGGAIRHLGLSGATPAQLAEARRAAPVVAVQNRFNLFDHGGASVLPECEREGIAFVPYFPLAAGMIDPKVPDLSPEVSMVPPAMRLTEERRRVLDGIAGRHGASRARVALAWLLGRSPVILAIPGTASVRHLEDNVAAAGLRLDADEIEALDRLAA